jgi:hypothetical protein
LSATCFETILLIIVGAFVVYSAFTIKEVGRTAMPPYRKLGDAGKPLQIALFCVGSFSLVLGIVRLAWHFLS